MELVEENYKVRMRCLPDTNQYQYEFRNANNDRI